MFPRSRESAACGCRLFPRNSVVEPALIERDWEVVMRSTDRGPFSPEEWKAAVWALLIAAIVAALAMLVQQPSLGPWGAEQAAASMPGVLEAQPVAAS